MIEFLRKRQLEKKNSKGDKNDTKIKPKPIIDSSLSQDVSAFEGNSSAYQSAINAADTYKGIAAAKHKAPGDTAYYP